MHEEGSAYACGYEYACAFIYATLPFEGLGRQAGMGAARTASMEPIYDGRHDPVHTLRKCRVLMPSH